MTKIVLFCSAGMSTSLFVQKMEAYAKEHLHEELEISAVSISEMEQTLDNNVDVVVLAPQIRFQQKAIEARTDKPIFVIEMKDYGVMNVEKVVPAILELVKK